MSVDLLPSSSDNYVICTSSTRPTGRYGLQIYETDTHLMYVYSQLAGDAHVGWHVIPNSGGGFPPTAYWNGSSNAGRTLSVGIPWTIVFNVGASPLNTSNGVVTIPTGLGGAYWVNARTSVNAVAGERFIAMMVVNGNEYIRGTDDTARGSDRVTCQVGGQIWVNGGDTVDFRINQINGTARTTDTGTGVTIFQGNKVA